MEEEVIQSRFEVVKTLAKGLYTTVSLVRERNSGMEYALKALHIDSYPSDNIERLMWEVVFHDRVTHPNIIKKLESFQLGRTVYVLMEYAEKGDLFGFFWKHRSCFNEAMIRLILFQVAEGIYALHRAGLLHRDLKPENILLDQDLNVKLCDFGWSCEVDDQNTNCERAGTLAFMSPEALEGKKQGKWSDVWSFGMLIYELYHGSEAFDGEDKESRLKSILSKEVIFSESFAKDIADLFNKCKQVSPERRIEFCDIINHPAFEQFHSHPPKIEPGDAREKLLSAKKKYAPLLSSRNLRRKPAGSGISAECSKDSTPLKAKPAFQAIHTGRSTTENERSSGYLRSSALKRTCSPVFKPLSHGPKPSSQSEKTSFGKSSFHPTTTPQAEGTVYLSSSLFLGKSRDERSLEIPMTGPVHGQHGTAMDGAAGAYDPLRMLSNFSTTMNSQYALFEGSGQEAQLHKAVRGAVPSIDIIRERTKPKPTNSFMRNYRQASKPLSEAEAAGGPTDQKAALANNYSPSHPLLQFKQKTDAPVLQAAKQATASHVKLSARPRQDSLKTAGSLEKKPGLSAQLQADRWNRPSCLFESRFGPHLRMSKRDLPESLAAAKIQACPANPQSKWLLVCGKSGSEGFEAKLQAMKKSITMHRQEPAPQPDRPAAGVSGKKTGSAYSSLLKLSARHRDSSSQQVSRIQGESAARDPRGEQKQAKRQASRSAVAEVNC